MKRSIPTWFSSVLGAVVLLAVGYGLYRLIALAITSFATLQPTVSATLITGFVTVTTSVSAVVIGRYFEKRKEVEEAFRERRLKTYSEFLSTFMNLTPDTTKENPELVPFFRNMHKEMILWAGPKLLKAYISFLGQMGDPLAGKSFYMLEDFYMAIRYDLGHSNSGLARGDILSLVIKRDELEQLLANMKTDPSYRLKIGAS
jgi:hypothetical protein